MHYHGTPITPRDKLLRLKGRNFCVSFAQRQDIEVCHEIGQSVMLDNGAYTVWRLCGEAKINWKDYYAWVERWLDYKTTWAVIPDIVDCEHERLNDDLVREWPFGQRGSPVWHMNETVERFLHLCAGWERVCIGSTLEYRIASPKWVAKMSEALNALADKSNGRIPVWLHMLRGMSLSGSVFPFSSVDSSDVARNHNRVRNPSDMAARWDARQCRPVWIPVRVQGALLRRE